MIELVVINGLKFVGCRGNKADSVQQFVIADSAFTCGENFDITGWAYAVPES